MNKLCLLLFVLFNCSANLNLKAQIKIKLDSTIDERKSFLAYEAISQFKNFEITTCRAKKRNGIIIDTFENSLIKSKINYYKGLPDGKYESFYPNGNHKVKGFAYRGLKSGPWEYYYENGNLKIYAIFSKILNDHPVKWVEYFPNGSINYFIELNDTNELIREFELNPKGDTIFLINPTKDKNYPYFCKRRIGTTTQSSFKKSSSNKKQGSFYYKIHSSLEGIDSFFLGSFVSRERPSFKKRSKNSK